METAHSNEFEFFLHTVENRDLCWTETETSIEIYFS